MDCDRIKKGLNAYLDEMLPAKERAEVEAHLASCAECSRTLDELKLTVHLLHNLEEVEPPAWLTQKVMTRIKAEQSERKGFFARLYGWIPANLPATAVATLVIAVTAVVLMKSMEPQIRESMPATATEQPHPPAQARAPLQEVLPKTEMSRGSAQNATEDETRLKTQSAVQKPPPAAETIPKDSPATVAAPIPYENALKEKSSGKALKKSEGAGESIFEGRSTAGRENSSVSPQQLPAGLLQGVPTAAPAASPTVSPAPGPAAAPERGAARNRAISRDAARAEPGGIPAKAREEKASGVLHPEHQRVVTEKYAGGRPRVVITYWNASGKTEKVMEERFDEQGRRHGLHRSYDISGSPTAEVLYEHGEPVLIREFNTDGTLKTEESDRRWRWLNP
ncbi:MAG: hypothetical protein C0402_16415 [Thermodesulfovibrio sp.]|nr:hypothetical protein [Thermodesulfovibrio sp.]